MLELPMNLHPYTVHVSMVIQRECCCCDTSLLLLLVCGPHLIALDQPIVLRHVLDAVDVAVAVGVEVGWTNGQVGTDVGVGSAVGSIHIIINT